MFRSLSALAVALALAAPAAAAPPNVVLIVGDDQAWTDYGFMGHEHIKTPHLDKLASEGLLFKRGYVPTSLCRASLATMVTGLFPHQHKITSNDPPLPKGVPAGQAAKSPAYLKQREEMVALFEKSPNLARLLEKEGYASFQAGKWWEGNSCRCGGFTEGMTHGDPAKGGRHGDEGLKIGREGVRPVLDFLDKARKDAKPFFVWYAPMMPHTPHNPPERLLNKYKDKTKSVHVAKYWAMCEWFDETVGELLAGLEKTGQAENTVVIYLHDNGWVQDPDAPNFAPRSKRSQYDGGLRTPIIVKWPGKVKPAVSDRLASSIDVAPTVLAALGVKPTPDMPGIDLLDAKRVAGRAAVFGATFEHNAIDIADPAANLQHRWVVEGNWKLIVPHEPNVKGGRTELYDVLADPDERTDLAAKHPEKVAELAKKLDAWWSVAKP
ncbi:sulfatase : Arylsulfatase A family protein OS=Singulisphaera acidiphila (strain ATCC BAA-1392 / DSM 18658 / VKM B-2454 / MOB10) GN=Sinac_0925 PE=4 SV=1: Sulfatase [Gemmataceae bacterium]|nr:sulfatase : Arylsulfatase A family protein OS=Singulisphaera acidiphila (strain ATCC BAA-1392 / DSM 18658 / VKM B-2454 / MOB10) GN=Sinac_0925 PE=4 SV=1: Sulfatase [Gemmataceae bacterium]VTU02022.1 sulfatase : Arylsulfatase A family protein OS=Singulisphaera acidiphila (strain ATCC BAA-1392 / DSM 18658 / VKM B-2454 / MOB10) GN=Sinac_0925 PE=4 SV=1: Sulfatase [Gemmataceae bacterium]